jgi:hypothetical protein
MSKVRSHFIAFALVAGCSSSPSPTGGNDTTLGGSAATGATTTLPTGGKTSQINSNAGGTLLTSGGAASVSGGANAGGMSSIAGNSNSSSGGKSVTSASGGTLFGTGGMTQSSGITGGTTQKVGTGGTRAVVTSTGGTGSGTGGSSAGGSSSPPGDEYFVATTGNDTNPGTKDKPFLTIAAAQVAVRANADRGKVPIYVTVQSGTYYVGKTIVFTSADSGTQTAPVTYRGGGTAALSGGVSLGNLTWSAYKNGIMQAAVPASTFANYSFDDGKAAPNVNTSAPGVKDTTYGFSSALFLNGQRQHMARYPNYKDATQAYGGNASNANSRPGSWAHAPTSAQPAYLHGVHGQLWGSEDYVVTSKTQQNGPLCNGRPQGLNGTQFIENGFDELDAAGEWYYDRSGVAGTANTLYFYPPSGVDLTKAGSYTLEMAAIERIFEFAGGCGTGAARTLSDGSVGMPSYSTTSTCAPTPPVQWVTLDGFHYIDTLRTFPSCNEQILRSDWRIYRGGSIFVTGGQHVTLSNSFFDQVGSAGVFVNGYNDSVAITGNLFVGTGSSAILFMGSNKAVRNPVFGYGAGVAVNQLDMTPGPQTNDYPSNCSATENLIHDIGDPELQVAGVGIDMAANITVSHNSIYNMPRAGINVGDGCWGGHMISYNDVFATVLFTGDHGAYNSWGRDRFWDPSVSTIESRVGNPPSNLPLLDVMNPITLTHNRWRCDQGWDIDLDDGSTNYKITNNVFLSGGVKWREGYFRDGENNVLVQQRTTPCAPNAAVEDVSGCLSIHVWPKGSSDVFIHNIFWGLAPDIPNGYGKEIDYNLFQSASQLATAQGTYHTDAHSASGNPNYIDPTNGNFQLGANSPASALGIVSLPAPSTEQYGVTVPQLRAQAATPPFGNVGLKPANPDAGVRDCTTQSTWRGATLENLCAGQLSVVGLGYAQGVYVVTVPAASQAATDGLNAHDVILQFGGQSVASVDDLNRLYAATGAGQKVSVGVYRNQQDTSVTITR